MSFDYHMLFAGQVYLLVLLSSLIIAECFKRERVFSRFLSLLFPQHRKMQLFIASIFAGILPIDGRIAVSLPLYADAASLSGDVHCNRGMCIPHIVTMTPRQKMGVVSYLATHHYYFWSPLEKSTILIMAGLHLSYSQFLTYSLPFLLSYLGVFSFFIFKYVDSSDVVTSGRHTLAELGPAFLSLAPFLFAVGLSFSFPTYFVFPLLTCYYLFIFKLNPLKLLTSLRWDLVVLVATILIISNVLQANSGLVEDVLSATDHKSSIIIVGMLLVAALASFTMGAAAKFAGITVMVCSALGMLIFPLMFILEFLGYFVSPIHKCTLIACRAFDTPELEFYKVLFALSTLLITLGLLEYILAI